jgi:hypothetical protein
MRSRGGVLWVLLIAACSCSGASLGGGHDGGARGSGQRRADAAGDPASRHDAAPGTSSMADAASHTGRSDGGTPPTGTGIGSTPDGGAAPGTVAIGLPSREIGRVAGTADAIAADANGVYWLNRDNELWMFDEAVGGVPRRLASEAGPSIICEAYGRLAAADGQLFWVAEWSGPGRALNSALHRTSKTGDDVALTNDIAYADPIDVVVDASDIYWNEGIGSGAPPPGTFVRTLPRNAVPGTSPQRLVTVDGFEEIGSVALIGSDLYWTTVFQGTTMFRPELQRADLSALRQGTITTPTPVGSGAWMVRGHDGNLFLSQQGDLWHIALARMPESLGPATSLAVFEDSVIGEIAFLDRWALTSVWTGGCGSIRYTLLAIPTDGAGPTVQLAADLVTPAVVGRDMAFIDATGMLRVVSVDDVRAALAGVSAATPSM